MLDLYNQKYSREELKKYIYAVNLLDILKTQILDISFITNFILNKKYQLTDEEEKIDIDTILKYQKHIKKSDLVNKIFSKMYDTSDCNDKIEDFETFSDIK